MGSVWRLALVVTAFGQMGAPVVYEHPADSIVPRYRYVGREAIGKVPFYTEYGAQNDEESQYRGDLASWLDNLEVITEYATCFPITLRSADEGDKMQWALELARRAFEKQQLIVFFGYDKEGVDKLATALDRLEAMPDGQAIIRSVVANKLGDEPYLGGRPREEIEELIRYFDEKIQSRYPHIQSWVNFAVSTDDIKTWGAGEEGRQLLPRGLDIVGFDYYAYLGNGAVNDWGFRDFRKAEQMVRDWFRPFMDDQTRRLKKAIAAVYPPGEEPMMWLIGNSSYVWEITHPTPVWVQDMYFEYVRDSEWAGLIWWIFEDFKDSIGGRHHEIIRSHQRHGRRIREERLY